jgi:hypothetical protein
MRNIVFTQYFRAAFGEAALRLEVLLITAKSSANVRIRFAIFLGKIISSNQ